MRKLIARPGIDVLLSMPAASAPHGVGLTRWHRLGFSGALMSWWRPIPEWHGSSSLG